MWEQTGAASTETEALERDRSISLCTSVHLLDLA